MTTFNITFPCRLRSDRDRSRSETVAPILTNRVLQDRLRSVLAILSEYESTCGTEEHRRVRGVDYTALFGSDWELRIRVLLYLRQRRIGQSPDGDNLWKPIQNALGFPSADMVVPGYEAGGHLYTLAAEDAQITEFAVRKVPHYPTEDGNDIVAIRVVALPPPHLRLAGSS